MTDNEQDPLEMTTPEKMTAYAGLQKERERLLEQIKRLRASENKLHIENEELIDYKNMIDHIPSGMVWDRASKEWITE